MLHEARITATRRDTPHVLRASFVCLDCGLRGKLVLTADSDKLDRIRPGRVTNVEVRDEG